MISFLFEQYGYYPKTFHNNEFVIDGWNFKLIDVDCDDEYIEQIDTYIEKVRYVFLNKGPYLIKTRFNKKASFYNGRKYILICSCDCNLTLSDLNKFHFLFKEDRVVNLKQVLSVWEEKILHIESSSINSLRVDSSHYKENIKNAMFCLGLAQNALQYLSELILDYGENIENVCLAHKRLKSLHSDYFFNPFNFIVDHPTRDLIQLYKNDFITFQEFQKMLEFYEIDSKIATLIIARMLYPACVFDSLESNLIKKDVGFRLDFNIEKEFYKIKKVYLNLKLKYGIRPIDWLEN